MHRVSDAGFCFFLANPTPLWEPWNLGEASGKGRLESGETQRPSPLGQGGQQRSASQGVRSRPRAATKRPAKTKWGQILGNCREGGG